MTLTAWICPDLMDTRSACAPACSTAARGSVYSTSSTPSVARKATRRPSSCRAMVFTPCRVGSGRSLARSPPASARNTGTSRDLPCVKQVTSRREPERPAARPTGHETPVPVDRRAASHARTGGLLRTGQGAPFRRLVERIPGIWYPRHLPPAGRREPGEPRARRRGRGGGRELPAGRPDRHGDPHGDRPGTDGARGHRYLRAGVPAREDHRAAVVQAGTGPGDPASGGERQGRPPG